MRLEGYFWTDFAQGYVKLDEGPIVFVPNYLHHFDMTLGSRQLMDELCIRAALRSRDGQKAAHYGGYLYSEQLLDWIDDLGIEVRIAKRREDLKAEGLHLVNPSVTTLVSACYDALIEDIKTILVYLKPIG